MLKVEALVYAADALHARKHAMLRRYARVAEDAPEGQKLYGFA